jgi:hypothetical protein
LRFTFVNHGGGEAVDVSVTFAADQDGAYASVGETDRLFLGAVPPGESVPAEKELLISADAPALLTLEARLRWQSGGEDFSDSVRLFLPIFNPDSVQASIALPPEIFAGEQAGLEGFFINMGGGKLYGLTVRLDGDVEGGPREISLGDATPGEVVNLRASVLFTPGGSKRLLSSFSFSDEHGNPVTLPAQELFVTQKVPPVQEGLSEEHLVMIGSLIFAAAGAVLLYRLAAGKHR